MNIIIFWNVQNLLSYVHKYYYRNPSMFQSTSLLLCKKKKVMNNLCIYRRKSFLESWDDNYISYIFPKYCIMYGINQWNEMKSWKMICTTDLLKMFKIVCFFLWNNVSQLKNGRLGCLFHKLLRALSIQSGRKCFLTIIRHRSL